jgi:hypothetical protein
VIGKDEDWDRERCIPSYDIFACCLSPSEDTLVTGGYREGFPVFSVQDLHTTNYITTIHPCGTHNCTVYHVSFDQSHSNTRVRTGCTCGRLYLWDVPPTSNHSINQHQMESTGLFRWWAEDGSKAISMINAEEGSSYSKIFFIAGISMSRRKLSTGDVEDRWLFSPETGKKILHLEKTKKALVVWACSSEHRLFERSLHQNESFKDVCFSPDSNTIIYSFSALTEEKTVELISSNDGTVLWSQNRLRFLDAVYYPNQTKILFISTLFADIEFVNPSDGSISEHLKLQRDPESIMSSCLAAFLSPNQKKIAILVDEDMGKRLQIFDCTTGKCLVSQLLDILFSSHCYLSWSHSFFLDIGRKIISQIPLKVLSDQTAVRKLPKSTKIWLSPSGRALLRANSEGQIHLQDIKSLDRVRKIDINPLLSIDKCSIEFSEDSSTAIIERGGSSFTFINLLDERSKTFPVLRDLTNASFFPGSNRILATGADASYQLIDLDILREGRARRLPHPLSPFRIIISPTHQLVALIDHDNLVLWDLGVGIIGSFLGTFYGAGFSPDGTHLCTVQRGFNKAIVSCISISNRPMRKRRTSAVDTFDKTCIETLTYDNRKILIVYSGDPSNEKYFFDCSDGKRIIPAVLHEIKSQIYYGDHQLLDLPLTKEGRVQASKEYIAYIDAGQAVVLDCSLLIDDM